jgi:ribosomal protein L22
MEEQKQSIKHETKKIEAKTIAKKEAVVNGRDLSISLKHAIAICNFIKGKEIDQSIKMLEEVSKLRKAVPMTGEIPHRKGKIMSGRFPVLASLEIIKLLKSLKSNALFHEIEIEKTMVFAKADVAPRPYRRFGAGRFKRAHVTLKLVSKNKKGEKK